MTCGLSHSWQPLRTGRCPLPDARCCTENLLGSSLTIPIRRDRPRDSGFAAQTTAVAIQVEPVGTDHSDCALHIVGTIAGATSTVVVPDADLEALAFVGVMAVTCRGGGWGGGVGGGGGGGGVGGGAAAPTGVMVVSGRPPAPAVRDWEMTVPAG